MPERLKVRERLARRLLGGFSFLRGVSQGDADSTVTLALEHADAIYRDVVGIDLQRALHVARTTHATACADPQRRHERDETCGHCLHAALLDLQPYNMGMKAATAPRDPVWNSETPEELAAHRAEHEREEAGGWRGGEHLTGGGLAEELTLHRHAQRSGACVILSGPDHITATVQLRAHRAPARRELLLGLQVAVARAQQEIDRQLRGHAREERDGVL